VSTSGGIGGGGGGLSSATVQIDGSAISTLNSVPVELVAAPNSGHCIVPVVWTAEYVAGTAAFVFPSLVSLYYGAPALGAPAGAGGIQTAFGWNGAATPTSGWTNTIGLLGQAAPDPMNVNGVAVNVAAATGDATIYGPIVTSALNDGGSGYATGDTGTIDGNAYGSAAAYVVDTVDGGGAVLTYTITDPGDGYTTATGVTTTTGGSQPGAGMGFVVDITAVADPDGDLYVTLYYLTQAIV